MESGAMDIFNGGREKSHEKTFLLIFLQVC